MTLGELALRVVSAEPSILAAIAARIGRLGAPEGAQPDMEIRFVFDAAFHVPPRDGRLVYESAFARVEYSPSEDAMYAFHEGSSTMRCAASEGRAEIVGSAPAEEEWVLTRPLFTLALMELARRRGLFPVHAACLARAGAGVLVCGPSGSGKSTLALALLQQGLDFLGDDLVFLHRAGGQLRVVAFPDELGLADNTRTIVPSLPDGIDVTPPRGWPKARVDVSEVDAGASVVPSCAPHVLLLLSEDERSRAVEPADTDSALRELLPNVLLTDSAVCGEHVAILASLTSSVTIGRTAARPSFELVSSFVDGVLPTARPERSLDRS